MRYLTRLVAGLRALLARKRVDEELDEELRGFWDASVDAKVAAGLSRQEASRAARIELGSPAAVKDWVGDAGWETGFDNALRDIRYAVRMLRRAPAFSAAAIATFALGIGANTAIFSIVDAAVLKPLPYEQPDRLVRIRFQNSGTGRTTDGIMPRDFLDWREKHQVFEHIALTGGGAFALLDAGEPEEVRIARVSSGFFEMFRMGPMLGRIFTTDDEIAGRDAVVILSHSFWKTRFGATPEVVGRTLRLDGKSYEIVGVMPEDFVYPAGARRMTPMFLPFAFTATDRQHGVIQSMGSSLQGRLRDGVTLAQAGAAMSQIQMAADVNKKAFNKGYTTVLISPLLDDYIGTARAWMLMLLGAVGLVLLIACANVANLVLAHGATRVRELTVRSALGGSRWRIARQLVAESLVLAVVGAMVGIAGAWWGLNLLRAAIPGSIPRAATIGLDWRVLAFTGFVAIATGLICGLLPALHGSRVDLVRGLKEGAAQGGTAGKGQQRVRLVLVWTEIMLAVMMLVGAGLFIASFARLLRVEQGFDASGITVLNVSLPHSKDSDEKRILPSMLEAVRAVPGVQAAMIASGSAPFEGGYSSFPVRIAGRPPAPEGTSIRFRKISTGFLEMLRVPLRRGRTFTSNDTTNTAPVALVNEAAVREFWPDQDPLGARLEIETVAYEIVGVVGNMRYSGPASPAVPDVFLPYEQTTYRGGTFIIRGSPDATSVLPAVKAAIWQVDPSLPIKDIRTAEELLGRATATRRFNMLLMTIFGALALVIAATGIYGVIAFNVSQRTREIGVRMALGARRSEVIGLFVRQGAAVLFAGIASGLVGAWMLARTVHTFLFEVQPRDLSVFATVATVLALIGLAASWIPARRAAGIDPLTALRSE